MICGYKEWNRFVTQGMAYKEIGEKKVYTFLDMKSNYYEILEERAKQYPDKVLICDNWQREYTYKTFIKMVDGLAAYLLGQGAGKRTHIGLLLHSSIEFCTAFYAICKIGGVAVPFPTKYREPELRALMDKADLELLLCSDDFEGWVKDYEAAGIKITYAKKEEEGYGFRYLGKIAGTKGGSVGELTDEVIIMFTSGTTSASKGVVLKNYNIIHAAMIYQRTLDITPEDKTIIPVPIYHITGLIALLGLFVYAGGTIYLNKRYDAEQILHCIEKNNITFMHGSPTVYGLLLDLKDKYPRLDSIRCLACGSSYMPIEKIKEMHQWMPNMKFQIVYGMTETSSPGTVFPYDAATSIYKGSTGKPIPGMELMIKDEAGIELLVNEVGSVYIRGANILEYYYRMETQLIDADGWLDTGDMGYVNEDGYIFIVDRKKDMINRGGEKIWCTDVEEAMLRIKEIRDAAVVGIQNDKYGEVAAAVVVLNEGMFLSAEMIKDRMKTELARYKIPEQIKFVDKIPKTPGLKVDKKNIRKMF